MEAVLDAGSHRSQDPGGDGLLTVPPPSGASRDRHLLVYDGDCGFCRASVAWARERDREGRIEARPFQETGVLGRAGVTRQQARRAAWLVAPDGRRWSGAAAVGRVLTLLPGWKLVGRLLLLPGIRWIASLAYRWVADHRPLVARKTGIGGSGDEGPGDASRGSSPAGDALLAGEAPPAGDAPPAEDAPPAGDAPGDRPAVRNRS